MAGFCFFNIPKDTDCETLRNIGVLIPIKPSKMNRIKLSLICLLVFGLSVVTVYGQPRFLAYNFYQLSQVTASSPSFPSESAKNAPLTLTGIGIGGDNFMWFDAGLLLNAVVALTSKSYKGSETNAAGHTAIDMGFFSFTLGKQFKTEDKYTIGIGVDCDIRGFSGNPSPVGPLLFTLGPAVCGQYRPNKIFTFVSLVGAGMSFGGRQSAPVDGYGVLWRNFVSVGYGVFGFNIGPDLHFFNVKSNKEEKWRVFTSCLQAGISFRLE